MRIPIFFTLCPAHLKLKDSFGIDGISSRVLKHLPPNFIIALSILINSIIDVHYIRFEIYYIGQKAL